VVAYGADQLTRNRSQRVVAEYLDGAVVGFKGGVEGQLVLGQPQRLATRIRFAHVLRQRNQLLDDLRCLNRAILITANRLLEHLGKRTRLHTVLPAPSCEFALEKLL